MSNSEARLLGFYETPKWVSDLIAANIKFNRRAQVIDLGSGKGALLRSIKEHNPKCFCSAIEVNENHTSALLENSDSVHISDLVSNQISQNILKKGVQRTFVSNPPFGKLLLDSETRKTLQKYGLIDQNTNSRNARLEALFLSRALECAQKGSQIAFIVPSSILHHSFWRTLRHTLINEHRLWKICILPQKTFQHTEVETAILFLNAATGRANDILIEDFRETSPLYSTIPSNDILDHIQTNSQNPNSDPVLASYLKSMYRGRSCTKELKQKQVFHLHSSDVKTLHSKKLRLPDTRIDGFYPKERFVQAGDILVARVGTRCIGSAVRIESGQAIISDSVISIRVPKAKQSDIFNKIASENGQNWLKNVARGACAKILTYQMLEKFPLGTL